MSNKVSIIKDSTLTGWEAITHFVLENDYCCGCGVCAGICPCNALTVEFNEYGEYKPTLRGNCTNCGLCSKVCPFINGNPDENDLSEKIFDGYQESKHTPELGYYLENYVGHVADPEHQWKSASGGMATWFLENLIKQNVVDHIICVLPNQDYKKLFKFDIISKENDIILSAKSVYYPVELSGVLDIVRNRSGRYALIGLPCFIKAVRLASIHSVTVKKRIVFYAGLTCGHVVSKGFTETLIRKMRGVPEKISRFDFRVKKEGTGRLNFSFMEDGRTKLASPDALNYYYNAWATGVLKLRACNFCDDIFAELSDISFMDARLPEYSNITSGTSIVIARSHDAKRILDEFGIRLGGSVLKKIDVQDVLKSQTDVLNLKRHWLGYRLWIESRAGKPLLHKRVKMKRPRVIDRLMVLADEAVRDKSYVALRIQQNSGEPGLEFFLNRLKPSLFFQKNVLRLMRLQNRIRIRLRRLLN